MSWSGFWQAMRAALGIAHNLNDAGYRAAAGTGSGESRAHRSGE